MSIRSWPENERPRERLFRFGPEALSNVELLAILVISGNCGKGTTAVDCARMPMGRFCDLRSLSRSSSRELLSVPGIGPGKASRIMATMEIARRIAGQKKKLGTRFSNSREVFESYAVNMRDEKQENFTVLLLDTKNRFLSESPGLIGEFKISHRERARGIMNGLKVMARATERNFLLLKKENYETLNDDEQRRYTVMYSSVPRREKATGIK
jgi:DNA repair protein RadC